MDTTVQTLEYTPENIAMLEAKGIVKSSVSKPYSLNKAIRYSVRRGVYWFTDKWKAKYIDWKMGRV